MELKAIKTSDLKPYGKNPRKNQKTVELLCKAIKAYGYNQPILVDKNNVIIKGHARYEAMKKLGYEEIPCIISDNADVLNRQDRLADNKIHESTKWDEAELLEELACLDLDFINAYSFKLPDLSDDVFDAKPTDFGEAKKQKETFAYTHRCPFCGGTFVIER